MRIHDKINLITTTWIVNEYGAAVKKTTKIPVFANVLSVSGAEFFAANQQGIRAQFKIEMYLDEYNGEKEIEIGGFVYAVYRTYIRSPFIIEIYVEEKAGVNNDAEED